MKPFSLESKCIKCGSEEIDTTHRPKDCGHWHGCKKAEHMHRTCFRCDYSWDEAPLDSTITMKHGDETATFTIDPNKDVKGFSDFCESCGEPEEKPNPDCDCECHPLPTVEERREQYTEAMDKMDGYYLPIACPFCGRHRLMVDKADDGGHTVECEKCGQKDWELEEDRTICALEMRVSELTSEVNIPDGTPTYCETGCTKLTKTHYHCGFCYSIAALRFRGDMAIGCANCQGE